MNDRAERLLGKLKSGKTLFIIGLAGILLIFASSFIKMPEKAARGSGNDEIELSAYCTQLEKRVKKIVKEITGQNAEVLITLDGGIRRTYAEITSDSGAQSEIEKSSESEKTYITVTDADGNETALRVYEQYPEVRGVTVVYVGSEAQGEKIKSAVMAALGITSKRIYTVTKGGK